MTWFRTLEANEAGVWWAICSLDDQEFYGAGGFNVINTTCKKAEIGFWLLPEFWGEGLMQKGGAARFNKWC